MVTCKHYHTMSYKVALFSIHTSNNKKSDAAVVIIIALLISHTFLRQKLQKNVPRKNSTVKKEF